MANIESARPYVELVVPPVLTDSRLPTNEQVIVVDPGMHELTPVQVWQRLSWYVSSTLLLLATLIALHLAWTLYTRYKRDNISPITTHAADRRAVLKKMEKPRNLII